MHPTLFEIFGFKVPSYAVFMTLGYLVALASLYHVTARRAASAPGGLVWSQVWDLFIVMVIASILGSKIGHTIFEASAHEGIDNVWQLLRDDPLHWAKLGEPGYVWYGGMIGALGTAVFYFRRRPKLDPWLYSDAFAPAIMFGASVGRVGCLLAGCCYGVSTDVPWAIAFKTSDGLVHPTQLYDSIAAGMIGSLLLYRFWRRRFNGEVIGLLLVLYPLFRGTTEAFRGDLDRGVYGVISTSQILSIPLFLVGLGILWKRRSAGRPDAEPAQAPAG